MTPNDILVLDESIKLNEREAHNYMTKAMDSLHWGEYESFLFWLDLAQKKGEENIMLVKAKKTY